MLHAVCCLLQIIEPIQSRCAILRFTKLTDMNVLERLNVPLPIFLHRIPADLLDPSRRLFRGLIAISLSRSAFPLRLTQGIRNVFPCHPPRDCSAVP